jgi:GDPmannose 4,6-dehydratase
MFGNADETPQNEQTPFRPRSPYGISKVAGFYLTTNYREACGLFACNGILFNHESERRGYEFVTRKVTGTVARIKHGLAHELRLGNLDARRDWGYAPDYVEAMWRMLQQEGPDDYVVATGESHSVREFVEHAFDVVGLDWHGYVLGDELLFRPTEIRELKGEAHKARRILGWRPSMGFRGLVETMVEADIEKLETQRQTW